MSEVRAGDGSTAGGPPSGSWGDRRIPLWAVLAAILGLQVLVVGLGVGSML